MVEKCENCNEPLPNGGTVRHSNANLGPFSFSEVCDDCQAAAHEAYRQSRQLARNGHVAQMLAAGGLTPPAPAPGPSPAPAPKGG